MVPVTRDKVGVESLLASLRRRRWLVVLCFVVVLSGTLAYSLTTQKQYTAVASLLFRDPQLDQKLFGTTLLPPSLDPDREAATNVRLVSLNAVAERTTAALGGRLSASQISSKVEIEPQGSSDVVSIVATDEDPRLAARLAVTFGEQYIAFRREADRSKIREAQELVKRQITGLTPSELRGTQGRTLQTREEEFRILASLQTGNAELVEKAKVPTVPSSPRPMRNGLIGGLFGLLLGLALALVADRFDRRLRDVEELEQFLELPLLGRLPETRELSVEDQTRALPPHAAEAFRMLRARLRYFNIDRDLRSLLITSAAPRDGKSTVAWFLAHTAAVGHQRVLLLEADLRRPSLAAQHGLTPFPGLAEVLTHDLAVEEVIQQVSVAPTSPGSVLHVITAGASPPNAAELLESHKLAELFERLKSTYDLVIVDTPPMSVVSDALPLMQLTEGVIIVTRLGKTTRTQAEHLRDELRALDAPTLGIVANGMPTAAGSYGYYGYYGGPSGGSGGDRGGRWQDIKNRGARPRTKSEDDSRTGDDMSDMPLERPNPITRS